MVRSQSKTNAASKPLMIRGDRLLLFVDILEVLRNHLRHDGEWRRLRVHSYANPRRLSLHRIVTVLKKRFGVTEKALCDGLEAFHRRGSWWIRDFQHFLRSNAGVFGARSLDVEVILARISVSTHDCSTYCRLCAAIAKGKLTEKDFQGASFCRSAFQRAQRTLKHRTSPTDAR